MSKDSAAASPRLAGSWGNLMLGSSKLVSANGIRIHVVEAGEGDPVFFLHSGLMDWMAWLPQIEYLKERGYRCIAWDMRGCGKSDRTFGTMTLELLARDLHDVFEALELERAHIVGWSVGTSTAIKFVTDYPEKVRSLALVGGPFALPDHHPEAVQKIQSFAATMDQEAVLDWFLPLAVAPENLKKQGDVVQMLRTRFLSTDPMHLLLVLDLVPALERVVPPAIDQIRRFKVPVIEIAGEIDQLASNERNGQLIEAIPGARMEVIPGASHFVNLEQPELVNKFLEQHLSQS